MLRFCDLGVGGAIAETGYGLGGEGVRGEIDGAGGRRKERKRRSDSLVRPTTGNVNIDKRWETGVAGRVIRQEQVECAVCWQERRARRDGTRSFR